MQIEEKLKVLYQLKQQKIELSNQLKNTESLIDMAQAEIVDEFESRQIKSMKIEGVGNFVMRISAYPKVTDVSTLRMWMESHEIPWETITALHAKKFQGWYRELCEQGQPLPEGCENYTEALIAVTKED